MSSTTIYLKLPQVKEVYEPEVYLGMIADVHSSDRAAEAKAKAVKITSFFRGREKEAAFWGNVMELVEKIEKTGQNTPRVTSIGGIRISWSHTGQGRRKVWYGSG